MSSALIIYSTGYPHRFLGALLKVFYLFQNKKKKTPVRFQIHHTTSSPHGDLSRGDLQAGIKYPFEAEYVLKYIRRLENIQTSIIDQDSIWSRSDRVKCSIKYYVHIMYNNIYTWLESIKLWWNRVPYKIKIKNNNKPRADRHLGALLVCLEQQHEKKKRKEEIDS